MKDKKNIVKQVTEKYLANQYYCFGLLSVLSISPITSWFAIILLCFMTLRDGYLQGFKALLIINSIVFCWFQYNNYPVDVFLYILLQFTVSYGMALVLRTTSHWEITLASAIVFIMIFLLLVQWLSPEIIVKQYQVALNMFSNMNNANIMLQKVQGFDEVARMKLSFYFWGLKAVSFLMTSVSGLLMARLLQAKLYNPNGLVQELLRLRLHSIWIFALLINCFGVYENNYFAISSVPMMFITLVLDGIIVFYRFVVNQKTMLLLIFIVLPFIFIPYIIIPIYALAGLIDSLFTVKWLRQPVSVKKQEKRGV